MSLRSRAGVGSARPSKSLAYRESFVRDVYRLVARGYQSLTPENLSEKEEPAITGLLVDAIERLFDDPRSPKWMERYKIQEERFIHASREKNLAQFGKEGKHRPRVDIEIESSARQPRPRFQFEAKRLRLSDSKSRAAYLGPEGLGCFLSGRYASRGEQAGMLGYVQSGSSSQWAFRIDKKLKREAQRYGLATQSDSLQQHRVIPEIQYSYLSKHVRSRLGNMNIHHILLRCHAGS